jgi:hypothetical protein
MPKKPGEDEQEKGKPGGNDEIRDYGYGGHIDTNYLTGETTTTVFTGPMDQNGNSPHKKVAGRGPW